MFPSLRNIRLNQVYLTGNGNSAWSIRLWNVIRKFPSDNLKGWSWTGYADHGPCEDTINIQTMTTMLMGYKRPEYLAKIGRIQAAEWTIDMLEDAIEQQTPYISDYF